MSALERANELSDAEDHTQAIAYYEEAADAYALLKEERWNMLMCVFNLGLCLRQADRLDAAIGAFARALALAEDQRTPFDTERERKTVQCKTHDELGKVLADKQSFTESLHHFTTALDIAKTMRDSLELQGIIRRHMANVLEDKGDTDQALAVCGQALEDLQTAGSEPYEIHQTTVDLATVHIVRDEHATAVDLLHEAINGFESLPGTEFAIAHARASLANALRFLGRFAEAERQYALADTVFRRSGRQSSIAYNLQNSALNYAEQGKWEAADRTYSEALSKFEELGVSDYETGRTLMNHSETIRLTGNPERAEEVCRQAIAALNRAEGAGGLVGEWPSRFWVAASRTSSASPRRRRPSWSRYASSRTTRAAPIAALTRKWTSVSSSPNDCVSTKQQHTSKERERTSCVAGCTTRRIWSTGRRPMHSSASPNAPTTRRRRKPCSLKRFRWRCGRRWTRTSGVSNSRPRMRG